MGFLSSIFGGGSSDAQPWDYMDASGNLEEREAAEKARDERFSEAIRAACEERPPLF